MSHSALFLLHSTGHLIKSRPFTVTYDAPCDLVSSFLSRLLSQSHESPRLSRHLLRISSRMLQSGITVNSLTRPLTGLFSPLCFCFSSSLFLEFLRFLFLLGCPATPCIELHLYNPNSLICLFVYLFVICTSL